MPSNVYRAYNFAMNTTAAPTLVTTGTAIKTMLQISTPSTQEITVIEWGVMIDAGSTVIRCELIDTDVAATGLTAHVASGLIKYTDAAGRASNMTLGTGNTGFTATTEGTTTASRLLGFTVLSNTGREWQQLPLGREPMVAVSRFLRFRVTATVAVGMACYIDFEER